jgi:hypothetical protein
MDSKEWTVKNGLSISFILYEYYIEMADRKRSRSQGSQDSQEKQKKQNRQRSPSGSPVSSMSASDEEEEVRRVPRSRSQRHDSEPAEFAHAFAGVNEAFLGRAKRGSSAPAAGEGSMADFDHNDPVVKAVVEALNPMINEARMVLVQLEAEAAVEEASGAGASASRSRSRSQGKAAGGAEAPRRSRSRSQSVALSELSAFFDAEAAALDTAETERNRELIERALFNLFTAVMPTAEKLAAAQARGEDAFALLRDTFGYLQIAMVTGPIAATALSASFRMFLYGLFAAMNGLLWAGSHSLITVGATGFGAYLMKLIFEDRMERFGRSVDFQLRGLMADPPTFLSQYIARRIPSFMIKCLVTPLVRYVHYLLEETKHDDKSLAKAKKQLGAGGAACGGGGGGGGPPPPPSGSAVGGGRRKKTQKRKHRKHNKTNKWFF